MNRNTLLRIETPRNKRKVAAIYKEIHEEHPRNSQVQDMNVSRVQEDYITQVSEVIEGRVTKMLCQEFSRTESRILGALSKLDEFLLNPKVRVRSRFVPETSRNPSRENQKPTEIVPRMILILKQGLLWVNTHKIAAQQMPTTTAYNVDVQVSLSGGGMTIFEFSGKRMKS